MGYALLKGKHIYGDLFDHKGFIIYVLNALGLAISQKWGILFIQSVLLSFTLYLWWAIARRYLDKGKSVVVIILSLIFLGYYFQGGNLSEEWSLLFITYPLYIVNEFILDKKSIPSFWKFVLIGICAGIILNIRVNNLAPCILPLIYMAVVLLKNQQFSLFANRIFAALLGFIAPTLIILLYFYCNNGLEGIKDLYYGTIGFNLDYLTNRIDVFEKPTTIKGAFVTYLPIIILFALMFLKFIRERSLYIVFLAINLLFTCMVIGKCTFPHYLIISIPVLLLCLVEVFTIKVKYLAPGFILFIPFLFLTIKYNVFSSSIEITELDKRNKEFSELLNTIPDNERDKVWSYNCFYCLDTFIQNDFIQSNKVFLPFQYNVSDKLYFSDYNKLFEERPMWIFVDDKHSITDTKVEKFLLSEYNVEGSTNTNLHNIVLLKHK